MKRQKFLFLILTFIIGSFSCSHPSNDSMEYSMIPEKKQIDGVNIEASSITTKNIDNYLFREDVIYVDLRSYAEIAREGHIAGFSFYPFYDFIASSVGTKDYDGNLMDNRLFKMKDEFGKLGTVGNFEPNYEESEEILNMLFPKDKYIFTITISCNESVYFLNLLKQYGYDSSKLYNVGGFSMNTGFENLAYKNIESSKYLVKGNPFIFSLGQNVTFDFMKDLTPINYSND